MKFLFSLLLRSLLAAPAEGETASVVMQGTLWLLGVVTAAGM
ncbi:MAG: hypothetical protein ACP5T5_01275 [Thermoprotei archaeon]